MSLAVADKCSGTEAGPQGGDVGAADGDGEVEVPESVEEILDRCFQYKELDYLTLHIWLRKLRRINSRWVYRTDAAMSVWYDFKRGTVHRKLAPGVQNTRPDINMAMWSEAMVLLKGGELA